MNKLSDIEKIALGKRLTLFRNALEMTQEEFGNAIGKGRTTIFSWEKGKTQPPEHYMRIIEKATWNRNSEPVRVNPDYIRKGAEPMFLPVKTFTGSAQVEIGGQIKEGGFIAAPPEDEVAIIPDNHEKITRLRSQVADTIKKTNSHPGIKVWAYAGAGNPFNADPAESEPMEVLHIESLVSPRYRDAFRITGISMAPVIRDKALVFCDFNDKILKTGGIYALNIPGEGLVVKEIRSEKEEGSPMRWVVYSYNEALYKPLYYALNELQEIGAIIGRIVLIHQELPKEGVHINLG